MFSHIIPKLPMRNAEKTRRFYKNLGFSEIGKSPHGDYLMFGKDKSEIHFFLFSELIVAENYGQVYIRVEQIEKFYHELISKHVEIHPNGHLNKKPWGQREFSLLDPDTNLLTFGEAI